ncbi:MAG: hypothetical protein ABW048_04635 [Sphingobium sp.]|jgi:hypothetical protein
MHYMTDISTRPTLGLSFNGKARRQSTLPTGTLSRAELRRIVAEMVG